MSYEEPLLSAADTRLHNSGWGRPPEQHRTPAIGAAITLDVASIMRAWAGASPELARLLARASVTRRPYTRGLIAQVTSEVLLELTNRDTLGSTDPLVALRRLRNYVVEREWTRGICFMAATQRLLHPSPPSTFQPCTKEVALILVAVAFAHPPAVIWSAEPSLSLFQAQTQLTLHWLRAADAHPLSHKYWGILRDRLVAQ
jgi:hypothetical protein